MGTNEIVGNVSEHPEAGDFDEVEQGFFAAAPPEVAVAPPPAPSFDDLDDRANRDHPNAVRRRRAPRRSPKRSDDVAATPGRLVRLVRVTRALTGPAGRRLAAEAARAWSWTSARARLEARRLAPTARLARERLGAFVARVAQDLPERPDGKSMAAAVAALVVVFGLSASVLGSRSNPRLTMVMEPLVVIGATPSPPEPALAPSPAPEPVVAEAPVFAVKHAHAKRHLAPARKVAGAAAAAPARNKVTAAPARKVAPAPLLMKPAFMR